MGRKKWVSSSHVALVQGYKHHHSLVDYKSAIVAPLNLWQYHRNIAAHSFMYAMFFVQPVFRLLICCYMNSKLYPTDTYASLSYHNAQNGGTRNGKGKMYALS